MLEPLPGYLILAKKCYEDLSVFSAAWNFGLNAGDTKSVADIKCFLYGQLRLSCKFPALIYSRLEEEK